MLANWIHIILVHIPILATPWLAYRVYIGRKQALNEKAWKNNFSATILLTILIASAYFTGPEASEWVKEIFSGFSQGQVEDHALWGRIAFVVQGIIGLVGVMGWASILQDEIPDKRIVPSLMLLLLVNTLILIYTAHLGGMIRRPDLM